jgi:cytoplasmic iron level regulating protein YaaA (DUF328/UPF0246 family)
MLPIQSTIPQFIEKADLIVSSIKHLRATDFKALMKTSAEIADRVEKEYQEYIPFNPTSDKAGVQAGALFDGYHLYHRLYSNYPKSNPPKQLTGL